MSFSASDRPAHPIRFWQHWRAMGQIYRDYPPGADALVDQIRSSGFFTRFCLRFFLLPLYFSREQGWVIYGDHDEMAAIMYLRRNARQGIRVLHIDTITVNARFRRLGLAQRLLALAEELARAEQRPFLKLAVTVTNTPAVTLYRQLGYQEQHHRFFTFAPISSPIHPSRSPDITLLRIPQRRAAREFQRFYHREMASHTPEVADLLVTYYPQRDGITGFWRTRSYVLEQAGKTIGCGDVYRWRAQWKLRLSLHPELWGTESERQAIQQLMSTIEPEAVSTLYVPSAAHFEALCSGTPALASELGFVEKPSERMIMVKRLQLA